MGQFSWFTQDTNQVIRNNVAIGDYRAVAYMHDDKGNVWHEPSYSGYGEFGGKDYYQLLAEMNGLAVNGNSDHDRDLGINLEFSDVDKSTIKFPNLTRNPNWTWVNEQPERDPNQGWGDYDDDDLTDDEY